MENLNKLEQYGDFQDMLEEKFSDVELEDILGSKYGFNGTI